MHPLSVVEEPAFVELVTGLCPSANVMSRRTLGRRVDDMFKSKMLVVKDELCKQEHVCTTADVWSTSKRSYMGVTCHRVDADTLSRHQWLWLADALKDHTLSIELLNCCMT